MKKGLILVVLFVALCGQFAYAEGGGRNKKNKAQPSRTPVPITPTIQVCFDVSFPYPNFPGKEDLRQPRLLINTGQGKHVEVPLSGSIGTDKMDYKGEGCADLPPNRTVMVTIQRPVGPRTPPRYRSFPPIPVRIPSTGPARIPINPRGKKPSEDEK